VAEQLDREDVVVLLGTPTEDASRLYAMIVTTGDPSWAGALAGLALDLPVYHVTEEAVRAEIAPSHDDEHLALMAMAMPGDAFCRQAQGSSACPARPRRLSRPRRTSSLAGRSPRASGASASVWPCSIPAIGRTLPITGCG
jgi:betaine reductase